MQDAVSQAAAVCAPEAIATPATRTSTRARALACTPTRFCTRALVTIAQVISTARTCNLILIILDCLKPLTHKRMIEKELEGARGAGPTVEGCGVWWAWG